MDYILSPCIVYHAIARPGGPLTREASRKFERSTLECFPVISTEDLRPKHKTPFRSFTFIP